MSNWIKYQWFVELIDVHDNIVDTQVFGDNHMEARKYIDSLTFDGTEPEGEPVRFDWGVRRSDAYEPGFEYAYVRHGGEMENEFDTGRDVPRRFVKLQLSN